MHPTHSSMVNVRKVSAVHTHTHKSRSKGFWNKLFSILGILILNMLSVSIYGQDFCGTPDPSTWVLASEITPHTKSANQIQIPVQLHVLQDDSGNGGINEEEIYLGWELFRKAFLEADICVKLLSYQVHRDDKFGDIDRDKLDLFGDSLAPFDGKFDSLQVESSLETLDVYYLMEGNFLYSRASAYGGTSVVLGGDFKGEAAHVSNVLNHEVGHCFGLFHTFRGICDPILDTNVCLELVDGSNSNICGDLIFDTPADNAKFAWDDLNCEYDYRSCPNNSIQNQSFSPFYPIDENNDVYNPSPINFMTYIRGGCMKEFTPGQVDRMHYYLNNDSNLLALHDSTPCLDLMIKDHPFDLGIEPNPTDTLIYISENIWVRNQNDGIQNQVHQNPIYIDSGDSSEFSYVYVKVQNKGCKPADGKDYVALHWAKASTGLSWPDSWDGDTFAVSGNPLRGESIGGHGISGLKPGKDTILAFRWNPPDPALYAPIFGNDTAALSHFCLLANVKAINDPTTTYSDMDDFVRGNNNVAWKNLSVIGFGTDLTWNQCDDIAEGWQATHIVVENNENTIMVAGLNFEAIGGGNGLNNTDRDYFVKLNGNLYDNWVKGGRNSVGLSLYTEQESEILERVLRVNESVHTFFHDHSEYIFKIDQLPAQFQNIALQPGGIYSLGALSLPKVANDSDFTNWDLNVRQVKGGKTIGGVVYQIQEPNCELFQISAGPDVIADLGCPVQLKAVGHVTCNTYEWTNEQGLVVSTDSAFSFNAAKSGEFTLFASNPHGCLYQDKVSVELSENAGTPEELLCVTGLNVFPNPSEKDEISLSVYALGSTEVLIQIVDPILGGLKRELHSQVENGLTFIPLDVRNLERGLYQIILSCPSNPNHRLVTLFQKQ